MRLKLNGKTISCITKESELEIKQIITLLDEAEKIAITLRPLVNDLSMVGSLRVRDATAKIVQANYSFKRFLRETAVKLV